MSFPERDRELLRELNSTEMSAALFQGAVHALEELGEEAFHLENRIFVFRDFFSKKGYSLQEAIRLAKAMEFRLEALVRLKDEHGLLNWGIPDTRTSDNIQDPYLAAAAMEPLIEHGWNEVAFDPERFWARLTGAQPS